MEKKETSELVKDNHQTNIFVNIFMGGFLLILFAFVMRNLFILRSETSSSFFVLKIGLWVLGVLCLIGGLYLVFNPKKTMKAKTFVKWYKINIYGYVAGVTVIWTIFLISLVYLFFKGEIDLTGGVIFAIVLATILLALVCFAEIAYMKGLFGGKKWIRMLLITVSLIYFIKSSFSLISVTKLGETSAYQFIIALAQTIFFGLALVFVLLSRRIKEYYSK